MRELPRLLALLMLLSASPQQEGPSTPIVASPRATLPPDMHATRVGGGVLHLQTIEGQPLPGDVIVGPGWYFTAFGYERLQLGRVDLEERVKVSRAQAEECRQTMATLELRLERVLVRAEGCSQLAAAACATAAANTAGYSPSALFLVGAAGLLLGLLLGVGFVLMERLRGRDLPARDADG